MKNSKNLIIITGPSGVGKGTVVKALLIKDPNLLLSISATTRKERKGEIDGEHYYFLSRNKFEEMIKNNLFLEWAEFAGNYYGTILSTVMENIEKGRTVILEIEVDGAQQVREKFPNACSIFLLPPDKIELERRIRGRATDSEDSILKRLNRAEFEIKSSKYFNYLITNQDLDETVNKIFEIIKY